MPHPYLVKTPQPGQSLLDQFRKQRHWAADTTASRGRHNDIERQTQLGLNINNLWNQIDWEPKGCNFTRTTSGAHLPAARSPSGSCPSSSGVLISQEMCSGCWLLSSNRYCSSLFPATLFEGIFWLFCPVSCWSWCCSVGGGAPRLRKQ